jgi:hypothetical protein|tara:strand:+ start:4082 stop:4342 length:261 start_codon:yes stop_codon:yes gene_type:complete
MIQILLLKNDLVLISRIEEVGTELGEPDCKLIKPFEILFNRDGDPIYQSWPHFTDQKELMIHSDSILTIVEPNKFQLDKYQQLTAE